MISATTMLFPSRKLAAELYRSYRQQGVFSELSYNLSAGLPSRSAIPADSFDPNNYDDASVMTQWMARSDFYDYENLKYLIYFDSFEEIGHLLRSIDPREIHLRMSEHHRIRSTNVYSAWKVILDELSYRCRSAQCHVRQSANLRTGSY